MSTQLKLIPKSKWIKDSATNICHECSKTIKSSIFRTNKHHCRCCGHIICSNCSSNRLSGHIICASCRHSNHSENEIIQTYSKLINMGFSDDISLKAANKCYSDVVQAIDYILANHITETDKNTKIDARNIACNADVKLCQAVQRIINSLKLYQHNDSLKKENGNTEEYSDVINDYHHILSKHNDEKDFETIHHLLCEDNEIKCDIANCQKYIRNHRDRQSETNNEEKTDDIKLSVLIDILDTIHVDFVHSFHMGFRIKKSVKLQKMNEERKENDVNRDFIDTELQTLKKYLVAKRKRLQTTRGQKRMQNNKFNTEMLPIDDNDTKEQTKDYVFSFGESFMYWPSLIDPSDFTLPEQATQMLSQPKYPTFKEEILSNLIFTLNINEYDKTYAKGIKLLQESTVLQSIRVDDGKCLSRCVLLASTLDISHIMSLIFYTDYDTLSYNFSKTFRTDTKISSLETYQQAKKRNEEYYHWSKLLNETIICYGDRPNDKTIYDLKGKTIFYHGVSFIYFNEVRFWCSTPISTTTKLEVATIFAKNDGIVVELIDRTTDSIVKYFDCSLVSAFANESERLFIYGILEIKSARLMSLELNCEKYFSAISKFQSYIDFVWGYERGRDYLDWWHYHVGGIPISASDCAIINDLMNNELNRSNDNKYPDYVQKCFHQFCENVETVYLISGNVRCRLFMPY
eukprot:153091_1